MSDGNLVGFTTHDIKEFFYGVNLTAAYEDLQVGAYSDLFAYEFCLIGALLIGEYLNVLLLRACRFHIMFLFELAACALGSSGFQAYYTQGTTPTKIGYSALVMIVVNLGFSLTDMILCFKNRALHTIHLLVANAALWVGCIATTARYRDNLKDAGFYDIWVFSFICMWGGAMIALPAPGVFNYLYFQQGPYNPNWVAVDPAEVKKRQEKAKREAEKAAEKKEREAQREKEKAEKDKKKKKYKEKPSETEMQAMTDRDFITVNIPDKEDEEDSDDSETEKRKKKKKKRSKKDKRDRDRDRDNSDKEEKEKTNKKSSKKDKEKDKEKEKSGKKNKKDKEKRKKKGSDDDSD